MKEFSLTCRQYEWISHSIGSFDHVPNPASLGYATGQIESGPIPSFLVEQFDPVSFAVVALRSWICAA